MVRKVRRATKGGGVEVEGEVRVVEAGGEVGVLGDGLGCMPQTDCMFDIRSSLNATSRICIRKT